MRARGAMRAAASSPSMADDFGGALMLPGRKKNAVGVRAWLVIDASGQAQVVEAGKHAIMRRTGLPGRDLRILDPLLSYPSTILGREQAIVINLEHIKAIITANEVLLLNSKDPAVVPFVEELQRRLPRSYEENVQQKISKGHAESQNSNYQGSELPTYYKEELTMNEDSRTDSLMSDLNVLQNNQKELPFEFRALEACLEAACSCLESETATLEGEAYPALDELTSNISTLNLERVRQIKSRLVAISGRVQKVRDELEHLLDDDEDMAEMYLTEKLLQQCNEETSSSYDDGRRGLGIGSEQFQSDVDYKSLGTEIAFLPARNKCNSSSSYSHTVSKTLDVEELEMLLEAYFVQVDGTLNKLSALREYVEDTEDYINIMLDDKQNHLLQMGVMLTTATLVVSAFVVVVGVFGMNITIKLFEKGHAGLPEFLWTVGGCTTGSLFLYVIAIAWCKHRRLLE